MKNLKIYIICMYTHRTRMVVPLPSPTLTTLNRSGPIAFFTIDNRILYSSDSDGGGGGGFPEPS